jgi:Mn2+/Fe2+ NRAMP family transporter
MELLHVSKYISIPVAAVAIWALVVFGSYKYAERLFLVLSLVFFAYPVAAFLSHPDYAQAGAQLAYPHFLATKAFLLLVVALIGTTITPYMQFYVAAAVVPLSTAYAISEARGVERSVSKSFRQAPLFLGLFTGQVFIGAAVALIPGNLIKLLVEAQVLNGLITPILLTYVLVLANRSSVLGDAVNGRAFKIVATISVVAVAILSVTVLVQTILSGLGIS